MITIEQTICTDKKTGLIQINSFAKAHISIVKKNKPRYLINSIAQLDADTFLVMTNESQDVYPTLDWALEALEKYQLKSLAVA